MEDPDEVGEQTKEVYARFGLAFYFAQVLEHGVVNALVMLDLIPNRHRQVRTVKEWEEMFDSFMSEHFERTMGRLFRDLRAVTNVPADLETLLRDALTRRNRLAHAFFRDHSENFLSEGGRHRMIADADECRAVFVAADDRLERVIDPLRRKAGITDQMVQDLMAKMKAEAESAG